MLTICAIPAFDDNYIWMLKFNNQAVVVDPGDATPVKAALKEMGVTLNAIIITHHHHDHTGGVKALLEDTKVPVYGPHNSKYKGVTHPLKDNDKIQLLGESFSIKEVPGHTLDHICYFLEDTNTPAIFCGDCLFLAGCGRVFEGSMQQMLDAMEYFKQLPSHTKVYCTHEYSLNNLAFAQAVEPDNSDIQQTIDECKITREKNKPTLPSTIEKERLINPFLRFEETCVKQSAEKFSTTTLTDNLAVFSTLRGWKDNF